MEIAFRVSMDRFNPFIPRFLTLGSSIFESGQNDGSRYESLQTSNIVANIIDPD